MADEHFFPAGDFPFGLLGTTDPCFFGSSGPYAPALDVTAPPFGMLPSSWAASAELTTVPADSFATAAQHFDSALSSLVSSPSARRASDSHDVAVLGDLIGRLGSIICSNMAASATNSCYSTPLSSPPRGASPAAAVLTPFRQGGIGGGGWCYPPLLETAGGGRLSRVASSKSLGGAAAAAPAALENAAAEVEETMSPTAAGGTNSKTQTTPAHAGAASAARKRKASGRGRTAAASVCNGSPKRSKLVTGDGNEDVAAAEDAGDAAEEQKKEPEPEPEPVKDYIHVRARRGQATDSHSLAERVRREKISERMNLLQSLVPGCNKITGKAVMLDEIINYVQSLQRQVEFLSMKLSTMNVVPHHHQQQQQLDGAGDGDDDETRYYLPAASASDDRDMMMLGYSGLDAAAAAFSSYGDPLFSTAMRTPHATTTESCTSTSFHPAGWDPAPAAQDLQSVVVVHRPQDQQQQQQQQHRRHDGKR